MEQLYLVEVLLDKMSVYPTDDDDSGADKKFTIKIKFGPKAQTIITEGKLIPATKEDEKAGTASTTTPKEEKEAEDDIIECENGFRKWSRTIRYGISYLFPACPDAMLGSLSKFPLDVEVWDDDPTDYPIYVGVGSVKWDPKFFKWLDETSDVTQIHKPLTVKQTGILMSDCGCRRCGELTFILRLCTLGDRVTTEFQQSMDNKEKFCFRTNKAPTMFNCHRYNIPDNDDPDFLMIGSLFETSTLEDPDVIATADKRIELCTELQSCGNKEPFDERCHQAHETKPVKKYQIESIRMGDITGPCGNANCALAHKIKAYVRSLPQYQELVEGKQLGEKEKRLPCGTCDCNDEKWHRKECIEHNVGEEACPDCGNKKKKKITEEECPLGTEPKSYHKHDNFVTQYMISSTRIPKSMESLFGKDFTVNLMTDLHYGDRLNVPSSTTSYMGRSCSSTIIKSSHVDFDRDTTYDETKTSISPSSITDSSKPPSSVFGRNNQIVYNVTNLCLEAPDDNDCRCNPPIPSPACRTLDCECIVRSISKSARKTHKSFCPSYKHKDCCPVMMTNDDDENELEAEEVEPLPYGLPPISLGPCPVLGRPCTVPDGFARMYKTAALPNLPPSYAEAGKVCCSKEFERIKKAIKEYMDHEKDKNDTRCLNRYNVDTERRCCDKEQMLMALVGKSCCGSHKIAIQEEQKKK